LADIEHSVITDPNIHEPKGASTATADQIYIADGAGSGAWTDIDTVLTTDNWTMNDLIHVKYESNTAESIAAETWTQRSLTPVKTNNLASVSLASNRISLPAGTYYVDASVPFVTVEQDAGTTVVYKAKLYNVTGSADLVIGTAETSDSGEDLTIATLVLPTVRSRIKGVFTLGSTSNVELRGWCSESTNSVHTGATEGSAVHVQSEITIWRIA